MHFFKRLLITSAVAGITAQSMLPAQVAVDENQLREALRHAKGSDHPSATLGFKPVFKPLPGPYSDNTPGTQAISLQDCFQQALEHNLELSVERYNPVNSLYAVRAAQGDYDPVFVVSGDHRYSESAGTDFDPNNGAVIPGPT